jgi:hypothetical protein
MAIMRLCLLALFIVPATLPAQGMPAPTVVIGGDNDRGATLGRVRSIAVLPKVLVVLERDAPHIQVFGHDGRLRQTLGRAGAGPGEYRAPFALGPDPESGELLIVDPANSRLTRYSVSDTLALESTTQIDVPMTRAVCRNGAPLLALAGLDSIPIRELQLVGGLFVGRAGIGRKASRHVLANHPRLQSYIAEGPMLCTPDQGRIFVASPLLGEILAYRPSRPTETVLISVPEFRPLKFAPVGAGVQLSMPEGGFYERIVDLRVRGNVVVVTIARIEATAPRSEETRGFRVVEIRDVQPSIVPGNHAWHEVGRLGTIRVCLRHEPVPTIGYFPQHECP